MANDNARATDPAVVIENLTQRAASLVRELAMSEGHIATLSLIIAQHSRTIESLRAELEAERAKRVTAIPHAEPAPAADDGVADTDGAEGVPDPYYKPLHTRRHAGYPGP